MPIRGTAEDLFEAHDQLSELTDVVITAIGNNELLQYDSASGKWVNRTLASMQNTVNEPGGQAVNFDGTNDRIQLPSQAWATLLGGNAGSCSISLWFKKNSNTNSQSIWRFSSTNTIMLRADSAGVLAWEWGSGTGVVANQVFQLNKWYHIVCVKTGTTSLELFVNGVSKGTAATTESVSGTTNAYISSVSGTSGYFGGAVDEVCIWSRALTSGEIGDLYNSGEGLYADITSTFPSSGTSMGTSIVAIWHLDDGSGNTAADSSGNGYDGTLQPAGEPTWVDGIVPLVASVIAATIWSSEDG